MHHPTVIAAYAEGRKWTFQGDVDLKSKFWGRSIELMPQGSLLLDFHDGDQYVWHKVGLAVQPCVWQSLHVAWIMPMSHPARMSLCGTC